MTEEETTGGEGNSSSNAATNEDDYIKTTTHNFISRKAVIEGPRQVAIQGRSIVESHVKIRGDLGIVRLGRYVFISSNTTLEPAPFAAGMGPPSDTMKNVPMVIGNQTCVGTHCHIQAAAIGSMVWIGNHVKIGKRCIIKDCCVIDDHVVLGDDTVIPPFTRVFYDNGNQQQQCLTVSQAELPPSMTVELQEKAMEQYDAFVNVQRAR